MTAGRAGRNDHSTENPPLPRPPPPEETGTVFPQDRNILEKIAAMTDIGQEGTAVEIGAGQEP